MKLANTLKDIKERYKRKPLNEPMPTKIDFSQVYEDLIYLLKNTDGLQADREFLRAKLAAAIGWLEKVPCTCEEEGWHGWKATCTRCEGLAEIRKEKVE